MPDDLFGERIIMLNKEKVRPFANAKSNEFLRETVLMNITSLWQCRAAYLHATSAAVHGSWHAIVDRFPDVLLLVKHFIKDSVFKL